MKNWLRKQRKAIIIDCLILVVFMIAAFYLTDKSYSRAQKMETTYPKTKLTQIEVGKNASMLANSITGATIHLDYKNYLRYAENANETFVIRERSKNNLASEFIAYTLINGYTYSAVLPFQEPSDYHLVSVRTKDSLIQFKWKLDLPYPGKRYYILALLFGFCAILATVLIIYR